MIGPRTLTRWTLDHGVPRRLFAAGARRGDLQSRLVAASREGDPDAVWPVIDEVRARGPLSGSRFVWSTVDHAVARQVLTSPDFRSGIPGAATPMRRASDWAASRAMHPVRPPSLLVTEPPDHTRYRKLVTRVFTNRAVERLRERTVTIAHDLLDTLPQGEPVDLVDAYCSRLPVTVIAEILGVPEQDRDLVLTLGSAASASLDLGLPWRDFLVVDRALTQFDAWLDDHIERIRRHPGDNLLSQLVAASDEHGTLDHQELKATAGLVLVAGFETTVNLLGNGIALLVEHPDQLERLRVDPSLWPTATDEILRLDPPVLLTGRIAARDTVLAGQPLAAGSPVVTVLAGANRDPQVFVDPDRFDVARENAREHLAFSAGRHHCLGAQLARMEGEVGLSAFFERFPSPTLLPGARRRPTRILRGYAALPARL